MQWSKLLVYEIFGSLLCFRFWYCNKISKMLFTFVNLWIFEEAHQIICRACLFYYLWAMFFCWASSSYFPSCSYDGTIFIPNKFLVGLKEYKKCFSQELMDGIREWAEGPTPPSLQSMMTLPTAILKRILTAVSTLRMELHTITTVVATLSAGGV